MTMTEGFNIWTGLLIFVLYFALDICNSLFIIALNRLQRGLTTMMTFLLYIGAALGIFQYTHHFVYAIFMASGAALGNFVLITVEKRKQKNKS